MDFLSNRGRAIFRLLEHWDVTNCYNIFYSYAKAMTKFVGEFDCLDDPFVVGNLGRAAGVSQEDMYMASILLRGADRHCRWIINGLFSYSTPVIERYKW